MKIKAFGKTISREKAYDLIINEQVCCFVYATNLKELEELLMVGWKALPDWSDEELKLFVDTLCLENQPEEIQSEFKI